jgi:hypothetical protein
MSKLNIIDAPIYKINDLVEIDWLSQPHIGSIEKIHVNEKNMRIYYVRSQLSNKLYNVGAAPNITATGFIKSKHVATQPTPPKQQSSSIANKTESSELQHAIESQRDFLNHFFDV